MYVQVPLDPSTFVIRAKSNLQAVRRTLILLDKARYQRAARLQSFLFKHTRRMRLLFPPAYSPQLAPIERLWKLT